MSTFILDYVEPFSSSLMKETFSFVLSPAPFLTQIRLVGHCYHLSGLVWLTCEPWLKYKTRWCSFSSNLSFQKRSSKLCSLVIPDNRYSLCASSFIRDYG
ncbi:hypothetical protein SASPL_131276 [Salvia splendens]|uniref:Uncharacterized protein n=1 Tax=Salvia splendens TaxID=180675 RepID=A0A8X8XAN8_SALSN|nr:hypothetical protein SASPL_131276 [Salvia splendens]